MIQTKIIKKEGNWEKKVRRLELAGFSMYKTDGDQMLFFKGPKAPDAE